MPMEDGKLSSNELMRLKCSSFKPYDLIAQSVFTDNSHFTNKLFVFSRQWKETLPVVL